ncbi:MAG: hypothetical protein QW656_06475, partial [Zestosphaera sp.]
TTATVITTRVETKTQTTGITVTSTDTVTTSVMDIMTTLGVGGALLVVGLVLGMVVARTAFKK